MSAMKVVDKLQDFPKAAPKLKGLRLEAHQLLKTVTSDKPVLVISADGANVAAVKRAFAAAAKARGGSVEAQNGDNGIILVRWSTGHQRRAGTAKARIEHSQNAIEGEMKRLYLAAGNKEADFGKLSDNAKRTLSISAKRNLSRRASA
jgi:hypothetical protein